MENWRRSHLCRISVSNTRPAAIFDQILLIFRAFLIVCGSRKVFSHWTVARGAFFLWKVALWPISVWDFWCRISKLQSNHRTKNSEVKVWNYLTIHQKKPATNKCIAKPWLRTPDVIVLNVSKFKIQIHNENNFLFHTIWTVKLMFHKFACFTHLRHIFSHTLLYVSDQGLCSFPVTNEA
jgi:hypothetical protein